MLVEIFSKVGNDSAMLLENIKLRYSKTTFSTHTLIDFPLYKWCNLLIRFFYFFNQLQNFQWINRRQSAASKNSINFVFQSPSPTRWQSKKIDIFMLWSKKSTWTTHNGNIQILPESRNHWRQEIDWRRCCKWWFDCYSPCGFFAS